MSLVKGTRVLIETEIPGRRLRLELTKGRLGSGEEQCNGYLEESEAYWHLGVSKKETLRNDLHKGLRHTTGLNTTLLTMCNI